MHFAIVQKAIANLLRIYDIANRETELMMKWHTKIEKEKDS